MNRLQSAKDSLYVALRTRLAALDPGRTVTLGECCVRRSRWRRR